MGRSPTILTEFLLCLFLKSKALKPLEIIDQSVFIILFTRSSPRSLLLGLDHIWSILSRHIKQLLCQAKEEPIMLLFVQELIHTIGRIKGRKGYMAIKIYLEKAYDKIEWSFIREMLIKFNFPANLIDLIMSYVFSVSTSLLFNGGCIDSFCPTRGIRQGDPLSPYLFILCMEFLGHLIQEKCDAKLWSPLKASRSRPSFSHLVFANDLVLFASADPNNCHTIKAVLNEFCLRSGQSVSEAKSRVFFSPNVELDQRDFLSDILGFNSTPNLRKYLGLPLKHAGDHKHDFDFVLDRVKKKLAGWKANLLSMVGRVVLIHASSSTIPNYVMQYAPLPSKILKGIDRVNRNSLWGTTDHVKKIH